MSPRPRGLSRSLTVATMGAIQRDAASDEARGKQPRFESNRPRASGLSVRDVSPMRHGH